MTDEIVVGGKQYVTSKRAAKVCGYAQDYVGQLARAGAIDAQRVGGLWYVFLESLEAYKRNSDAFTPTPPVRNESPQDLEAIVSLDGKDYVSAAKAAKLTGYNADYVGQLARGGKILSRQIGNRWYVERSGLLAHKSQKDSMLAVVQAQAVGVARTPERPQEAKHESTENFEPYLRYFQEDKHLMPVLRKPEPVANVEAPEHDSRPIPIKVIPEEIVQRHVRRTVPISPHTVRSPGITMRKATKALVALTVVIVISYGFTTIKNESLYAFLPNPPASEGANNMLAGAASTLERLADVVEAFVSPLITYRREI